jgi:hypothetical protein
MHAPARRQARPAQDAASDVDRAVICGDGQSLQPAAGTAAAAPECTASTPPQRHASASTGSGATARGTSGNHLLNFAHMPVPGRVCSSVARLVRDKGTHRQRTSVERSFLAGSKAGV